MLLNPAFALMLFFFILEKKKGMEKVKNAVVLIPAVLFIYFGTEIIFQSLHDLLYSHGALREEGSSLIAIIVKTITFFSILFYFK